MYSFVITVNCKLNLENSGDQETAVQCLFAVPSMLLASKEAWMTSFVRFSTFREDSLPSPLSLDAEMTLWQRKWERQDPAQDRPGNCIGSFEEDRPYDVS